MVQWVGAGGYKALCDTITRIYLVITWLWVKWSERSKSREKARKRIVWHSWNSGIDGEITRREGKAKLEGKIWRPWRMVEVMMDDGVQGKIHAGF
ncbi:hypothetical protein GOBAR_DD10683 [Gossypium barbadense]|nr:hypothetical protein GOBAR_DD10683 [Gossypium barbadense]